jgi:uncharacterized damage-inducible protein DinB
MTTQPEPWLRGPLPGIAAVLQPAAHAFVMAREDVERAVEGLTHEQLWASPGGVTPLGFHIAHLAGSTDRLLTYARGEMLSAPQKEALAREKTLAETRPTLDELLADWRYGVDAALQQLAATPEATVADARAVGRAQLPTTVLGLLFHAAEHASRHTGQVVTTAKIVKNS